MSKYGDSVRVKTKQRVIDYVIPKGLTIGKFYDDAVIEKLEREEKLTPKKPS